MGALGSGALSGPSAGEPPKLPPSEAKGGSSASPRETARGKADREGIQVDCGCLRGALFPYRRNLLLAHQTARHLAFQATDLPMDWKMDSIPRSISHIGVVRSSADCSRTSQASWSLSYRVWKCNSRDSSSRGG